jgi:isopentenyl diphosphate isomerase/L-lactate dehydrogenase-like FMN-dependent dehydrogenase
VLIAPMAMQCMAHPDGELAVSRAAAAEGIPMVRFVQSVHVMRSMP